MYTNTDANNPIKVVSTWLDKLSTRPDFPADFSLGVVKAATKIIMTFNHFELRYLNFLQLPGIAMVTSAVCVLATIYFGYHEVKKLIPTHQAYLYCRQLKRWIEDLFGAWVCYKCHDLQHCRHWSNFFSELNNFGVLKWTITQPSKQAVFLGLRASETAVSPPAPSKKQ